MNFLAKLGLWGGLVATTATALYAAPVGGWLSPSGASGSAGTTAEPDPVRASAAGVPLPELLARARALHDQTRAEARHIQHMQQVARSEKDVIKLNCVNDKLVQVKAQMNIADAGEAKLASAQAGERIEIFETIAQAAQSVRQLRGEADQCVGEPVITGGKSSNSFTGPEAADDPTKGFGRGIEPPAYASPYN